MITRRRLFDSGLALAATSTLATLASPALVRAHPHEEIALWPGNGRGPGNGGPSGEERIGGEGAGYGALSSISTPRMRVYRPNIGNGKAVIVCGGGGYFRIQLWKESTPAASWLQLQGYTVFELIYRLPADGWDASVPFIDAQRAMRIVRTRAADFDINPQQIGIMGFSAGGHLAGYTAYRPDHALYAGADAYENASARPDFAVLLFPVVSLRSPYDTTRTRREIIGRDPDTAAQDAWSLDTHASAQAPPTLIFSAADDPITPPGHGIALFSALTGAGAKAELHIFEEGGHGWGIGGPDQIINQWPTLFENWITRRNAD
jgi:acetyl esterase/lipase